MCPAGDLPQDPLVRDDGDVMTLERVPCWRGKRTALAPLHVDDAELIQEWRSESVAAHDLGNWPRSLSAVRERIECDQDDEDRDDFVVLLPDGTPMGHVALADQNMVDGTASVTITLAAQCRGQGLGTDTLDALPDLAFGELPLHRIETEIHTDNAAGLTLFTNAGFVHEGTPIGLPAPGHPYGPRGPGHDSSGVGGG